MVEIFDDKVSIGSPGGVPKGITKSNFGIKSIARNPLIADLLSKAHYIEQAGTGINRMNDAMKEAGLKEPQYILENFFTIDFLRPSYYDKNYGTYDLTDQENSSKNTQEKFNETQVKILKLIEDAPEITQKQIAEMIGMSMNTVRKNIVILRNKDKIAREGSTKKGNWIIKK